MTAFATTLSYGYCFHDFFVTSCPPVKPLVLSNQYDTFAGMVKSRDFSNDDVTSISKRLTTLEMKELNERQRAEHAVRMYDQQKVTLRQLEDRNMELESKFAEVNFYPSVL